MLLGLQGSGTHFRWTRHSRVGKTGRWCWTGKSWRLPHTELYVFYQYVQFTYISNTSPTPGRFLETMCNRFLGRIFGVISEEDPPPEVVSDPYSPVSLTHPQVGELKELFVLMKDFTKFPNYPPRNPAESPPLVTFKVSPTCVLVMPALLLFFFKATTF